ncbi:MAG: hypothetical protein ABJ370_00830 [Paracoccaceae bacterium]
MAGNPKNVKTHKFLSPAKTTYFVALPEADIRASAAKAHFVRVADLGIVRGEGPVWVRNA